RRTRPATRPRMAGIRVRSAERVGRQGRGDRRVRAGHAVHRRMTMVETLLECSDITKGFGGVPVLKGVALRLEPGTVTALAGENGAAKSTLMKISSGQYSADDGTVSVSGTPLTPGNPRDAIRDGVTIVAQELASNEART